MENLMLFILLVPIIIISITLHEFAHAWSAKKFGDNTAYSQGRVTLNPLSHIDPVGTVVVPALLFFTSGFMFGWAKPVPLDYSRLNNPRKDTMWVALAGPLANLALAALFLLIYKIVVATDMSGGLWTIFLRMAVFMNVGLAVFNMIPLPPLDGSKVLARFLTPIQRFKYDKLEPYGMWIILGMMFLGVTSAIMRPFMSLTAAIM